jgi:hypothetical protein
MTSAQSQKTIEEVDVVLFQIRFQRTKKHLASILDASLASSFDFRWRVCHLASILDASLASSFDFRWSGRHLISNLRNFEIRYYSGPRPSSFDFRWAVII